MLKDYKKRVKKSFKSLNLKGNISPKTAIILGSGLSAVKDSIDGTEIPFSKIKGFPAPTVKGHSGILKISDKVVVCAGRIHYYEGHSIDDVVLPIFLLSRLGVKNLIITNAAGGINPTYAAGELVLISDHINLTGCNPLIGINDDSLGPRFPDMSECYSKKLIEKALSIKPDLKQGVYAGLKGPSYETPAEVRMLQTIGADLVGMSTVNEVIAASYLGMNVIGISCVTNLAAGVTDERLDHAEVVEAGKKAGKELTELILKLLAEI
ncbi:MAG: purine-nucleoside phosphorylase [Spirochaetes bacterium]|nr:purine-nucleoside phosphorylase [Spirochaetota bacterium]